MADQKINALPTKTAPVTGDKCLMSGAAEEYLIDYDKLATAILNKLTSKKFTLDQGTKTLIAAINELNSKSILELGNTGYQQLDEYRNGARLLYGVLVEGRGNAFGLEYQYGSDSLHYGAQFIINYADGIRFRQLNRSIWSDWDQISTTPLS